ncbi:MAG: methyltransferase domain-containing protein [Phycisphaerae bacterium]
MTALGTDSGQRLQGLIARWEREDEGFARAVESGIGQAQALARLGVRLCLQEHYDEAVAVLRGATELAPADWRILNNLAVVLERARRPADAIAAARASLDLHVRQPEVWLHLANMLKASGDLPAADAAYAQALELEPASPIGWQMLGLLRQEQRRFRDAIDCFLKCARNGNTSPAIFGVLGQLFHQVGEFSKSLHAYRAAAEMDPANPTYTRMRNRVAFLVAMIDNVNVDAALQEYLANTAADAPAEDRDTALLLHHAFSLLSGFGHTAAAARVGQKRLDLQPASPSAAYLLKALSGDQSILRSPDDYLVEYFDAFAPGFDQQLTGLLGYSVPHQLCELLLPRIAGRKLDILDVGCGTGLCGVEIAAAAQTLTGIDLSPKMLEIARSRGLYHHLFCDEITRFLHGTSAAADLLLAADVLIYFGELRPLFQGFARVLRPGGLVALSVETADAPQFRLLPSGRFGHNAEYVRRTAAAYGLELLEARAATLRLEAATPVRGELLVFQLRGTISPQSPPALL